MSRCGVCHGTISEDTLAKHAFYCEDDVKASSVRYAPEVDDLIKMEEESK